MSLPQRNCSTPTSTEGLECASQRKQRLLVVSVNVGGLTTTKLNLLEEKTQQLSILMLQELHESGYKMLMERVKVSTSKGKWFFSKPPTGAAGVATYLAEELASNVSSFQSTRDRILKVVLQGTGKKKINVVNCYASHCGLGRESYRKFLKELSVVTRNLNKRRTLLLGGDFNAQVSRTTLKKEGKLGFSKRSNANGKLLANWLKIKGYSIVNHRHEERDYEALTQIIPKLVKDLVPEQSNNTVEQRASDQTRELLRRKNSLWDTSTVGKRKELTNAVKRSARKDKINWYIETASKIQSLFEQNRTREAYSLLNLVKPTAKIYARITKDDKGNKVDTCQRLKILSDYIASQQLPPIAKIHLTQDERVHYCRPIYEPVPEEHINSNPPLMDEVMVCIRQLKNNRATAFKLTTKIIHNRLQPIISKLPSYQAGFRSGHSTTNKIEILNNIVKKKLLQNTKLKLLFIDFQKAFDSVNHDFIQLSLKEHGVPSKLRKLIRVLYKNATVKVSEGKHLSKTVYLRRGVLQGDSLSPAIFILVLNSTIKRINTNTLANVEVAGNIFNYLAFADDLVALCKNNNQISSFIEQLYKLESLSGLRINLTKTKILLTDEGYSLTGQIPDKTINKLLTNFFCEKCQRYFHREKSLKAHLRSRFCDGTLNRRRAGTFAVKDTKYIVQKMLQPVAESISVLGEEVQPVKEMKYLGVVFNSTGIAQEHVLSNLDKCEARLTKYRDILSSNILTKKVKRQLARSMVLAPGIYNLGNWPLNNNIKKKLNFLTRKINSILNNVPIQEYRFCQGDLDIQKILLEQRRKYVDADDATADRQIHILREAGINNHLEPKDPKYISPTEACRKLGLEEEADIDPVPPIQDPPNHGPPQPIRLRRTYNVPGTESRAPRKENYLERAARYRGTAPARINPLTYVSELLGLTGTS
eukprot:augustus_masked-scaffold_15-processed-gene-4.15-mRNA-1 protein AED:1.00 eAED:1.00 QI:0/0/0/0/1/1/3/0/928